MGDETQGRETPGFTKIHEAETENHEANHFKKIPEGCQYFAADEADIADKNRKLKFLPSSREPVRQLMEDTESFLFRERGKRKEREPEYEHEYEKESRDIISDAG